MVDLSAHTGGAAFRDRIGSSDTARSTGLCGGIDQGRDDRTGLRCRSFAAFNLGYSPVDDRDNHGQ